MASYEGIEDVCEWTGGGMSEKSTEYAIIGGVLTLALTLVFVGRYAFTTGSEIEITGIGDLDIIGSGVIAAALLLFLFAFAFGVNTIIALNYPTSKKVVFGALHCLISAGFLCVAWLLGTG